MAKVDSIFSSSSSEQRWVSHMATTLSRDHVIVIYAAPACVFIVPKVLKDEKPDAYVPQKLGLGPYHHLRPDLYKMQRQKLAAAKRQLNPDQFSHFHALFIDKVKQLEPSIRVCYDAYLDVDGDTLAWMITIDGLFLFDLISRKSDIHLGDVMMLENQLPLFVLKEIKKGVTGSDDDGVEDLYKILREYCGAYSPLQLNEQFKFQYISRLHLLDYMYHLIVENRGIHDPPPETSSSGSKGSKRKQTASKHLWEDGLVDKVSGIANIVITGVGNDATRNLFTFIKSLPWDMISGMFKKQEDSDYVEEEESINPAVEEIEIPSVSCLCKIAQVRFYRTPGGIRDVEYDNELQVFCLPVITLHKYSEVILRNLVAYESEAIIPKPGSSSPELGEYVDLMCGLINTAEDARVLRERGIIKGDLRDEEIARLFNGISKSRGKAKIKSDLGKAIEKVNEQYENTWKVKADRFIKKHVYASWKFLTFVASILLILLLILQAFCQIYGCSRFFWPKTVASF